MLTALGSFLQVLNLPLNQMGTLMQLNAATYAQATGLDDVPMSTVAFNVFAGPWIYYLGNMAVAIGNLVVSLNTFLIQLKGAL